ncbi:MAG: GxGYxYP domain-containing protein [Armatimonadota bacterium]
MHKFFRLLIGIFMFQLLVTLPAGCSTAKPGGQKKPMYIYNLTTQNSTDFYDETLALVTMQGIINRAAPTLYVTNDQYTRPQYWLDLFSKDGGWMQGRERKTLNTLDDIFKLAGKKIKGAVIWDPEVAATVNVATTIAGVEDAVALSPEYADKYLKKWKLPVIKDLRGMFTGKETGSKKNDAYRWAIREYIQTGKCKFDFLCLYTDSYFDRQPGNISYAVDRDWPVKNRAFVYDLSPWGDEKPGDDPDQPMGTDLATYKMMLSEVLKQTAGKQTTEVAGFFNFVKYSNMPNHPSKHDPVPTEWETVYLISPYNCYQNTATEVCYNQSFHSLAPFKPLKQHRPAAKKSLRNKTYIAILMADYDSAYPLYHFYPNFWEDKNRGKLPLAWGINPNLIETYPDVISHFYKTATKNDYFVADASAAGYMNPNLVQKQYLPLFVKHNKHFYNQTDMTISGMVLDWDEPSSDVKDAFTKFSPDGFATIVMDLHGNGGKHPQPHVWKRMPVIQLYTHADFAQPDHASQVIANTIGSKDPNKPGFYYFRSVWVSPTQVMEILDKVRKQRPDQDIEVVDLYTFFDLFKQMHDNK